MKHSCSLTAVPVLTCKYTGATCDVIRRFLASGFLTLIDPPTPCPLGPTAPSVLQLLREGPCPQYPSPTITLHHSGGATTIPFSMLPPPLLPWAPRPVPSTAARPALLHGLQNSRNGRTQTTQAPHPQPSGRFEVSSSGHQPQTSSCQTDPRFFFHKCSMPGKFITMKVPAEWQWKGV